MPTRDPTAAKRERRANDRRRQQRCRARDRNDLFVAHVEFPREAVEELMETGYLLWNPDTEKPDKLALGRAITASWCEMRQRGTLKPKSKGSAGPT